MTASQAVAMLDDEIVPETELLGDDVIISDTFDDNKIRCTSGEVDATDLEATPILSPIYHVDLILAPNNVTDQGVTPSLRSSLQKEPSVASGAEGADDLITPSQLIEEFSTEFVDDLHVVVGAEGHTSSHSLERVCVVDPYCTLRLTCEVKLGK